MKPVARVSFLTPVKVGTNPSDIAKSQYRASPGGARPDEPACSLEWESPFMKVTLREASEWVPLSNVLSVTFADEPEPAKTKK